MKRSRFSVLVRSSFTKWFEERLKRKLGPINARLWGVTEAQSLDRDGIIKESRWDVKSGVYCPRNDSPSMRIESGCMYGKGEDEKWHLVLLFTLNVGNPRIRQQASPREMEFHIMSSDENSNM